jgi:hypothetical protein
VNGCSASGSAQYDFETCHGLVYNVIPFPSGNGASLLGNVNGTSLLGNVNGVSLLGNVNGVSLLGHVLYLYLLWIPI